jgi:hypothetical protein
MRGFFRDERGFGFVEVIIALVLVGLISIVFLASLGTGYKALALADEKLTAESLAKCQMELIKVVPYQGVTGNTSVAIYQRLSLSDEDVAAGYSIISIGRGGTKYTGEGIAGVPWNNSNDSSEAYSTEFGQEWTYTYPYSDTGLQRIVIVIERYGEPVFTLEGNKSNRDIA